MRTPLFHKPEITDLSLFYSRVIVHRLRLLQLGRKVGRDGPAV